MVGKFELNSLSIDDQEQWLLDVAWYSHFNGYDLLEEWFEKGQDHEEFMRVWRLQAAHAWINGSWYMDVRGLELEHYLKISAEDQGWLISEMTNTTDPEDIAWANDFSDAINYCLVLCRIWDYTRNDEHEVEWISAMPGPEEIE